MMKICVKIVSEKTPEYLVHTKKQWRRKREGNLDGGGLLSEGLRYFYLEIYLFLYLYFSLCLHLILWGYIQSTAAIHFKSEDRDPKNPENKSLNFPQICPKMLQNGPKVA